MSLTTLGFMSLAIALASLLGLDLIRRERGPYRGALVCLLAGTSVAYLYATALFLFGGSVGFGVGSRLWVFLFLLSGVLGANLAIILRRQYDAAGVEVVPPTGRRVPYGGADAIVDAFIVVWVVFFGSPDGTFIMTAQQRSIGPVVLMATPYARSLILAALVGLALWSVWRRARRGYIAARLLGACWMAYLVWVAVNVRPVSTAVVYAIPALAALALALNARDDPYFEEGGDRW